MLFITSPLGIGADTWIHLLLLRHLPQEAFELHAAAQPANSSSGALAEALQAVQTIPGVAVRPTDFGPSFSGLSRAQKVQRLAELPLTASSLLGLARYIRRHEIQILHASDRPRDAMACSALSAMTGAKALIHVHVKYGDWMSRGVKWALGQADALVGVSQFVADSLIEAGYRADRTHAVLNAIEPSAWNPATSPLPGRASLGVSPDAPLIVSVARLFHWKGHKELIRATALIKNELPSVRLAIVGGDYPENSGTTAALTALARELGVQDHVIFTGHRRDIAALLAAGDVFALPSFEEPFGLVYAEAMAMKRPVVALSNGGALEVVDHEKSGLLSAPGDIDGLAANLLRLLRDGELRARMGEYGHAQVATRFGPARMASDFAQLYQQLAR